MLIQNLTIPGGGGPIICGCGCIPGGGIGPQLGSNGGGPRNLGPRGPPKWGGGGPLNGGPLGP